MFVDGQVDVVRIKPGGFLLAEITLIDLPNCVTFTNLFSFFKRTIITTRPTIDRMHRTDDDTEIQKITLELPRKFSNAARDLDANDF